ncbi:MAG TPA: hypothetical protein VLV18_07240 [Terriglobales bacterium]|nr:hypothetical protein [Terriglobales bacterium]
MADTETIPKRTWKSKRIVCAVIVLVVVFPVLSGYSWYGLSVKPVVDFTFGGTRDLRRSYQLTALSRTLPGTIDITHILVENTGNTEISVVVSLHATNSVVSAGYYGPFSDTANIQITLPVNSGYQVVTFYLTLPLQVNVFSLRVDVNKVLDYSSLSASIATNFASVTSHAPTQIVYASNSTNPSDYELVRQS